MVLVLLLLLLLPPDTSQIDTWNTISTTDWTAILIVRIYFAKDAQCVPHRDNNDGYAVLIAFGDYSSGGELMVEDKKDAHAESARVLGSEKN